MAIADNAGQTWDTRMGQRLKLRDLHILTVVAQWGSMAKAASHLSTSQSVVSEAIANLESAVGVKLLDRTPRGVELTVYAEALLRRGHVVFDELREGLKDIRALAGATVGEVRLACAEFLAAGLIMDAVDAFSRHHPDAVCHVSEADVTSLDFRQLHQREVDLMVTRVPNGFADDDLNIDVLFDDPHLVVAGAKSPWAARRNLTLADLAEAAWIVPPSPIVRGILAEAFEAQGLNTPTERVVSSFILMRNHLLSTGRFVTLLPESTLRYNARQWALRELPLRLSTKPQPIAIVSLRSRTVSPVVQLFIAQLRAAAKAFARERS